MTAVDWAQVDAEQVTAVQDGCGGLVEQCFRSCAHWARFIALEEYSSFTAWRDTSMVWHQLAVRGESGRWYPVDGATLPPMREGDA